MKAYLEPREVEQLEKAATCIRDKVLIRLLFRLGCRISEALSLRVEDIDFGQKMVTVLHLKSRLRLSCSHCQARLGKSHHFCPRCGLAVTEPVARARESIKRRTLFLDPVTLEMLRDFIRRDRTRGLIFGINRHRAWQIVRECAEVAGSSGGWCLGERSKMEKDVTEFLKKMGMRDDQQPIANQWDRIIQRNSSYLIIGDVGTGKSALAYWLLETFSQRYSLQSVVVGLPKDKQELLPSDFIILDDPSECTKHQNTITFIDEADLQLPIEDAKARQYVVNFLSLPRHRKQIFLLAFHFPRLVLGRYLPFFSAFLLKRPPYLIEFAGKRQNDTLTEMMRRAEERFSELPSEADVVKHTYVVAPRIRWQGMVENPLCKFWSEPLSEVWSGTEIEKVEKQSEQIDMFPNEVVLARIRGERKGWKLGEDDKIIKDEKQEYFIVDTAMEKRKIELKRVEFDKTTYIYYIDPITQIYWIKQE